MQASFNARKLRGILAEERITQTQFAAVCGLNREYLSHMLAGRRNPGELSLIKIERGMKALGLSQEGQGNDAA